MLEDNFSTSNWDLSKFYHDKTVLIELLEQLNVTLDQLVVDNDTNNILPKDLNMASEIIKQIEKAESYYYCLTLDDTESSFLNFINTSISELKTQTNTIICKWQTNITNMTKEQMENLSELVHPDLLSDLLSRKGNSYSATNKAKEALRSLENDYMQLRNKIRIKVDGLEDTNEISFSKANKIVFEHQNPLVREKTFIEIIPYRHKRKLLHPFTTKLLAQDYIFTSKMRKKTI